MHNHLVEPGVEGRKVTSQRLRQKIREKEVEIFFEAFRREQIEKKKAKHVRLTGTIYV